MCQWRAELYTLFFIKVVEIVFQVDVKSLVSAVSHLLTAGWWNNLFPFTGVCAGPTPLRTAVIGRTLILVYWYTSGLEDLLTKWLRLIINRTSWGIFLYQICVYLIL